MSYASKILLRLAGILRAIPSIGECLLMGTPWLPYRRTKNLFLLCSYEVSLINYQDIKEFEPGSLCRVTGISRATGELHLELIKCKPKVVSKSL